MAWLIKEEFVVNFKENLEAHIHIHDIYSTQEPISSVIPHLTRSLLLMHLNISGGLIRVLLSLLHEVSNWLLEVIDAVAHLVDAVDDVVTHSLEACLHLGQHLLH